MNGQTKREREEANIKNPYFGRMFVPCVEFTVRKK